MKSIRHTELHDVRSDFGDVLNNLPSDVAYPEDMGSEPGLTAEAVQNWDAVREMIQRCKRSTVDASLTASMAALDEAEELYAEISATGYSLRERSNSEHIAAIRDELVEFANLAEL